MWAEAFDSHGRVGNMSKIMMVLGVILIAIGCALGLLGLIFPSRLIEHALTMDTAAILAVGGILTMGLGGLIQSVESLRGTIRNAAQTDVPYTIPSSRVADMTVEQDTRPLKPSYQGFGRNAADMAAGAVAATAATAAAVADKAEAVSPSVADTINALEQAKSDIRVALGVGGSSPPPVSSVAIPPPLGTPEEEEEQDQVVAQPVEDAEPIAEEPEEPAAGELYVVEEKLIRGRPARVLSDGTVEAETEEGWMRFENIEHLNEYMDG
jgi:hypothetical protein